MARHSPPTQMQASNPKNMERKILLQSILRMKASHSFSLLELEPKVGCMKISRESVSCGDRRLIGWSAIHLRGNSQNISNLLLGGQHKIFTSYLLKFLNIWNCLCLVVLVCVEIVSPLPQSRFWSKDSIVLLRSNLKRGRKKRRRGESIVQSRS